MAMFNSYEWFRIQKYGAFPSHGGSLPSSHGKGWHFFRAGHPPIFFEIPDFSYLVSHNGSVCIELLTKLGFLLMVNMWHHIHTYMDPSWVMEDFTTSTLATDFISNNRKPVFHRTKTHATGWLWHETTWETLGKTSPMKCLCETGPDFRCTLGVRCLVFGGAGGAVSSNTPPVTTPKPNACADERIWITSPCGSSMSRKKNQTSSLWTSKITVIWLIQIWISWD